MVWKPVPLTTVLWVFTVGVGDTCKLVYHWVRLWNPLVTQWGSIVWSWQASWYLPPTWAWNFLIFTLMCMWLAVTQHGHLAAHHKVHRHALFPLIMLVTSSHAAWHYGLAIHGCSSTWRHRWPAHIAMLYDCWSQGTINTKLNVCSIIFAKAYKYWVDIVLLRSQNP